MWYYPFIIGAEVSYICREDCNELKYEHFCPHFRPRGGPCRVCTKCDLYGKEDENKAIKEAHQRATEEYLARHPTGISIRLWSNDSYQISPNGS